MQYDPRSSAGSGLRATRGLTMKTVATGRKISGILTASMIAGALLLNAAGCARTASSSEPSAIQKAVGSEPAPPPTSGFLKDYSQLTPGGQGKPSLVYIDSGTSWASYDKILIDPVQFWAAADASISTEDQQALCSRDGAMLRPSSISGPRRLPNACLSCTAGQRWQRLSDR